jgi:hypothetical protein
MNYKNWSLIKRTETARCFRHFSIESSVDGIQLKQQDHITELANRDHPLTSVVVAPVRRCNSMDEAEALSKGLYESSIADGFVSDGENESK